MEKKKILWLCSWYPSAMEPFNGDFIQRHAKATTLYNDIHVIHVTYGCPDDVQSPGQEINITGQLTEQIIYFRKKKSIKTKLTNQFRWLSLFKKSIRNYIIKNGKPDIVHVHVPIKAGLLALWIKRNYKVPYVITEHWGIYNDVVDDKFASRGIAFKKYTRKVFQQASHFISVSKYLAEGVNKLICRKEYSVIPNVVNTNLFYYKEKSISGFRFIHVSNMVSLKNAEGILRSFKAFAKNNKDAELLMIGDTSIEIRSYANNLNLSERVKFYGEIPYEQVATAMQNADCLVLFSNIENSPCVIGEALCCGLPVIATDVGGVPELVDKTNSILIKAKDENALTQEMINMVNKASDFDKSKIAENAIRKFSYSEVGKQIIAVYEEVLTSTK